MLIRFTACLACTTLLLLGCEDKTAEVKKDTTTQAIAIPASHFTTSRPADVKNLVEVKQSAKKGDTVTFLARVGGKTPPFVDSQAIFIAADPSLLSCELMGEEDHCRTPEDYCCVDMDSLRDGIATIQFVDTSGKPIKSSADGAGGLESLKYIVVNGTVRERNEDGLFIVDADTVWVGGKPNRSDHLAGSLSP